MIDLSINSPTTPNSEDMVANYSKEQSAVHVLSLVHRTQARTRTNLCVKKPQKYMAESLTNSVKFGENQGFAIIAWKP